MFGTHYGTGRIEITDKNQRGLETNLTEAFDIVGREPLVSVVSSVGLRVVPNPSYIPVCAPPDAIFQRRERDEDCSVAVLCDIILWHDNIKGSEGHLGYVFSAALLPSPQALRFGTPCRIF